MWLLQTFVCSKRKPVRVCSTEDLKCRPTSLSGRHVKSEMSPFKTSYVGVITRSVVCCLTFITHFVCNVETRRK